MGWISLLLSTITGFIASYLISHPKALHKKLPTFKLKSLEVLPNVKFKTHSYEIHIHHWLIAMVVYITFTFYPGNLLESHLFLQGIIFGLFGQGLTYSDRFIFVKKKYHPRYAYLAFAYCSLAKTKRRSVSSRRA